MATLSADRRFSQENAALHMNGRSGEAALQRIDGRPTPAKGRECSSDTTLFGLTKYLLRLIHPRQSGALSQMHDGDGRDLSTEH